VTFRDRRVGGAVTPARFVEEQGLGGPAELFGESRLLFLIHGYNWCERKGHVSLCRLANLLAMESSWGIVGVLWPGDHGLGRISYSFEGRDADDTATELCRFIECRAPDVPVSFLAHSLGCRVALETVNALKGRTVDEVCLFAAAVDADSLASSRAYRRSAEKVRERITVPSSRKDRVLKFAYPAGDLLQAFLFWKDDVGLALGFRGPRDHWSGTVPGSVKGVKIPKSQNVGHGDYFPTPWRQGRKNWSTKSGKQLAAADFARRVLRGELEPRYRV